jgi:hypothetical protein
MHQFGFYPILTFIGLQKLGKNEEEEGRRSPYSQRKKGQKGTLLLKKKRAEGLLLGKKNRAERPPTRKEEEGRKVPLSVRRGQKGPLIGKKKTAEGPPTRKEGEGSRAPYSERRRAPLLGKKRSVEGSYSERKGMQKSLLGIKKMGEGSTLGKKWKLLHLIWFGYPPDVNSPDKSALTYLSQSFNISQVLLGYEEHRGGFPYYRNCIKYCNKRVVCTYSTVK